MLLLLAHGLYRRLDGAWHAAMWLLAAGIAASILKGFDYEEALVLSAAVAVPWVGRDRFDRPASLLHGRFSWSWIAAMVIAIGASIWLGLFAYRHVPYRDDLWWQFAHDADAPRMLRASLRVVVIAGAAALRQAHRRAEREGARFRIVPRAELAPLLDRLQQVSDDWLASRHVAEKGFSLGFFERGYLLHFPCAVVERDGRIVAFANLWAGADLEECSIDLMRHAGDAPSATMDYLIIETMRWGRGSGYRWFNLGMAPLSGLEQHRLAPLWHRSGALIYRYGEDFYNFDGLRQFKQKFHPEWRSRYLAAPGGVALPRVLLDVSRLVSGGTLRLVSRRGGAA